MKASDLVSKLNKLISEHGDFVIGMRDQRFHDFEAKDIIVTEPEQYYGFVKNEDNGKYDMKIVKDQFFIVI